MIRLLTAALLAFGLALPTSIPAEPTTPAVKLWRLDCGSFTAPTDSFSDLLSHPGERRGYVDSCHLIRHGNDLMLWDAGLPLALLGKPEDISTPVRMRLTVTIAAQLARLGFKLTVNPRGYVPALELDDGTVLTENLAILAYVAQRSSALFATDDLTPWRALEAISFMSSGIHANLVPFFKNLSTDEKDRGRQEVAKHIATLAGQLGEQPFLLGDRMTIADFYLFWVLRSLPISGIELPDRLQAYYARMSEEPSVTQALAEEGLA